jgi:hypothetical protein
MAAAPLPLALASPGRYISPCTVHPVAVQQLRPAWEVLSKPVILSRPVRRPLSILAK